MTCHFERSLVTFRNFSFSLEGFIVLVCTFSIWIIILGSVFSFKSTYSCDEEMEKERLEGRRKEAGERALRRGDWRHSESSDGDA